ncbi:MAG: hypothetical protein C0483_00935 [Pirellula sp.]|nr:hypothetical protein [Pirellula sp.]
MSAKEQDGKKADGKKDDAAKKPAAKPPAAAAPKEVEKKSDGVDPTQTYMASAWKYTRPLTACRYDPSGKYVFVGTEDYTVERIRVSDGVMTPLVGHESWCRAIGFTPDGRTTFTAGYDGRLLWWDTAAEKPTPLRAVAAHEGWIRALAVSPDGKLVATCGNDGLVKLWNTADGKPVAVGRGHGSHVYNIAFHPEGRQLVSCDIKGICKVWDVPPAGAPGAKPVELAAAREFSAATIYKYDTQFRADIGGARSLAFGDGGKLLAAGGIMNVTNAFAGIGNAAWAVVNFADGKPTTVHSGKEKVNGTAWGTVWHPAGYWIGAAGGQGGILYFFRPGAEAEFFKFKLPDTARDLSLAPDGRSIAVAHFDGNLRVYRMEKKA